MLEGAILVQENISDKVAWEHGSVRGPFFFLFLNPFYYLCAIISPSLRRNLDPGSLEQALLPPPHYGTRLHFCCAKDTALSSLVDSRRIVLTHSVKRSRQLVCKAKISIPRLNP